MSGKYTGEDRFMNGEPRPKKFVTDLKINKKKWNEM